MFLTILPVSAQNFGADELININVYERINPAIVAIEANIADGFSAGTGCVIRSDGVILTGSHVIDGAKEIDVTTSDGKIYKASVLAKWEKQGLSFVKNSAEVKIKNNFIWRFF